MKKAKPVVTLTPKGKLNLRLSKSLKPHFGALLEMFLFCLEGSRRARLTLASSQARIQHALIEEVYTRHYLQFSLQDRECNMLLTRAQAHAVWELCQRYTEHPSYFNPEVGNLLMHLHKTLL